MSLNDEPDESHYRSRALVVGMGVLLGTACFFAGRLSVRRTVPDDESALTGNLVRSSANAATSKGPATGGASVAGTQANPEVSSEWDGRRWRQLVSQPGTPARNATLAAMLENLAATDPGRAMAQAQAERNLVLRDRLVQATLRGWARVGPEAAANWVLTLPNQSDRSAAMSTVFASAVAAQPEEAVRVGKLIIQANPGGGVGYGSTLIDALCDAGHFQTAVQFAVSGGSGERSFWVGGAYSKWATLQPEQAASAAAAITDPNLRNDALHGVVGGWAEADPATLTQFLAQLPQGSDRASMVSQALQRWVRTDPEAAANWIIDSKMASDLNEGVAAVATMDFLEPKVALSWAESITDQKLRSQTLTKVLEDWVHIDLPAAKRYFETTTALQPDDRQRVTEAIAALGGQGAGQ